MAGEAWVDVREIREKLPAFLRDVAEKQIRFATIPALSSIASKGKEQAEAAMPRKFEKPTPYAVRSFYADRATKSRPFSEVRLRDEFTKGVQPKNFMGPNIATGDRKLKRYERALMHKKILPPGYFTAPGDDAKLDQYGNQSSGEIVQVLSALGAFQEGGYLANRTAASKKRNKTLRNFFVLRSKGNFFGVMERKGKQLRSIMSFGTNVPDYERKFPFDEIVRENWETNFFEEFVKKLQDAIRNSGHRGKWR